jgi:hypothetical protein
MGNGRPATAALKFPYTLLYSENNPITVLGRMRGRNKTHSVFSDVDTFLCEGVKEKFK